MLAIENKNASKSSIWRSMLSGIRVSFKAKDVTEAKRNDAEGIYWVHRIISRLGVAGDVLKIDPSLETHV